MLDLSWMAWTPQTAAFFIIIFIFLVLMGIWEWYQPGGAERTGILGITTTRGDRLFISLLSAAYIHLAWLLLSDWHLVWATVISLGTAIIIFRRV